MTAEIERIRSIKSFPSLVKYLKEELEWKIEAEDIEDLTFEYDAEDLGLDKATAVKIREIKQLRPLVTNQPWGIFYISFEKKRLPIVALRRILRSLVLKKRASANRADVATWNMNDLLFISSYGEDIDRELSFAHFSENSALGDLPTLKVLGWNSGNTKLRLEDTVKTLKEKLHWPDDDADTDEWRKQWSSAFTRGYRETVKTSKELAVKLADLAQVIRERVNEAIAVESENGELRKLHKAFQDALIHDLSTDDFADMYAQTIAYGLLSASVSRESGALVADNLKDMVPKTNPFLQELMGTFLTVGGRKGKIDFDELGINEVIELLRHTDMDQVKLDFGAKNPNEDPVIHFYELFLKEYDPKKRMQRGVFYTPRPVVSFIVRSVDDILRTEFGLEDGLADTTTWGEMRRRFESKSSPPYEGGEAEGRGSLQIPEGATPETPFVQILDPATGTGTFLVEVIDLIYKTMTEKWKAQRKADREIRELWNEYVPRHLLPRVYGFELMMAPYSIAHMKIGLKLRETGYRFISSERAQIYLTNALEEPHKLQPYLEVMAPALAHEADAANRVKGNANVTVIVGNPPYSIISSNQGEWIVELCERYKVTVRTRERQIQALSDDYVKFLRFSEWQIGKTGAGVIGMISNNGFLDGHLFVDMRRSWLETFDSLWITNLRGNSRTGERSPNGESDENVFDIQTGVAVSVLCRTQLGPSQTQDIHYQDVWGTRESKYDRLRKIGLSSAVAIDVSGNNSIFLPIGSDVLEEWNEFTELTRLFGTGNPSHDAQKAYAAGFVTQQDKFAIAFEQQEIYARVAELLSPGMTEGRLRSSYKLCTTNQWNYDVAREELSQADIRSLMSACCYRPFDERWSIYHRGVITILRRKIMDRFRNRKNVALLATRGISRQTFAHIFASNKITDRHALDNASESMFVFPLYNFEEEATLLKAHDGRRYPNLSPAALQNVGNKLGLNARYGEVPSRDSFHPEDLFHYVYGVLHSPAYRTRYAEFLKIDFPRIPLTNDLGLFRKLSQFGCDLVALHLMDSEYDGTSWAREKKMIPTENHRFKFKGNDDLVAAGFPKKELADIDENGKGKVYINKTSYFAGIPEAVWNFHIGGYQVCHKWLKDRKGRTLSDEDKLHYNKIAIALGETIRLMSEIDEVIESHGGWPLAGSQNKP